MVLDDLFTPLCVAAVLLDGNHAQILERARVVIGVHGLLHVLVSPAKVSLVSQQVALNPALRRLGFVAVLDESAFPDRPQHAREITAPITVGEAGARDDQAVWIRPFPSLDPFFDQSPASATACEKPSHLFLP